MWPQQIRDLPINSQLHRVVAHTMKADTSEVIGETGCGKTVSLCIGTYYYALLDRQKRIRIIMAFPTCLAVDEMYKYVHSIVSVPSYLAKMHGKERLGNIKSALLTLGTTGSVLNYLLRNLPPSNKRSEITMKGCFANLKVIVDESHSNTVENYELLHFLGWLLKFNTGICITIATATPTSIPFKPSARVEVKVRTHKVTSHWGPLSPSDLTRGKTIEKWILHTVDSLLATSKGNILVFVPNARMADTLLTQCKHEHAYTLYSAMDRKDQKAATTFLAGVQTVIFATNIAESSITFNVDHVVDSFLATFVRTLNQGLHTSNTVVISKAEAIQRAGRTGRLRPGDIWVPISEKDYQGLSDAPPSAYESNNKDMSVFRLVNGGLRLDEIEEILKVPREEYLETLDRLKRLDILHVVPMTRPISILRELDPQSQNKLHLHAFVTLLGKTVSKMPISLNSAVALIKLRDRLQISDNLAIRGTTAALAMLYGLCTICALEAKLANRYVARIPGTVTVPERREYLCDNLPTLTDVPDDLSFYTNVLVQFMSEHVQQRQVLYHKIGTWCAKNHILQKYLRTALRLLNTLWYFIYDRYGYNQVHFKRLTHTIRQYQTSILEEIVTVFKPIQLIFDSKAKGLDNFKDPLTGQDYRLDATSLSQGESIYALTTTLTGNTHRFYVASDCFSL